jgi:predicted transcriptional regulator of viral defense system
VPDRSLGAALSLLQRLLEVGPGGRVFTSEEAVDVGTDLGLTREHTYKLLSRLVDRGLLERPRGRLYVMQPPLGGLMPVRPLAIAVRAVTPAAVSGDTALSHWGLLSQAPMHEEVVSTPARIRWMDSSTRADGHDRLWPIGGTTIRFKRVRPEEMFGITSVRLDSETVVPMFDRERTILEVLTQSTPGSADWAVELLRDHGAAVDRARLRRYATQLRADRLLNDILHRPGRRERTTATA